MSVDQYTREELVEAIKRKDDEDARRKALPPEQQYAELLHGHLCSHNHVDMCDWHYGSWSEPCSSQIQYLGKAKRVMPLIDYETLRKVLDVL